MASNQPSPLLTTPWPPEVTEFVHRFLTEAQVQQLREQLTSSWQPNMQVMWTGMMLDQAEKWAKQRGRQTLSIAMGPLRGDKNAKRLYSTSKNALTKYMRGASAVFAWCVTSDDVVTLLCPPPPVRFNPRGGTNMQLVELPLMAGIIGGRAVSRIDVVHPMVKGAEDFRYQLWPDDEQDVWWERFGQQVIAMKWLQRKISSQVLELERMWHSLSSGFEQDMIYRAILPRLPGSTETMMIVPLQESEGEKFLEVCQQPSKGEGVSNKTKDTEHSGSKAIKPETRATVSVPATGSPGGKKKKKKAGICLQTPLTDSMKRILSASSTEASYGITIQSMVLNDKRPAPLNELPGSPVPQDGAEGTQQTHKKSSKKAAKKAAKRLLAAESALPEGLQGTKSTRATMSAATSTRHKGKSPESSATGDASPGLASAAAKIAARELRKSKRQDLRRIRKQLRKERKKALPAWTILRKLPPMPGSKTQQFCAPGQTTCFCVTCKADRPASRMKSSPSLPLRAGQQKASTFLAPVFRKLQVRLGKVALERPEPVAGLPFEGSQAEVCLQPAQAAVFSFPTASSLALQRLM